mmetsp:Transcript_37522/g.51893  ORF Transcript_37522/g.51893 Transcript_37522/m.51893 type:complete len:270 (+) Transcript_37522:109-918(+)
MADREEETWVTGFLRALIGKDSCEDLRRILDDFDKRNPGTLVQVQDYAISGVFAGITIAYCVVLAQKSNDRHIIIDIITGGAIAGAIFVFGLSRLTDPPPLSSSSSSSTTSTATQQLFHQGPFGHEYLNWPNQRQLDFFRGLLIPYTPPRANDIQLSSLSCHVEECDVCLEENFHFVLYLTCHHAVICPSCEVQLAFTRFTKLLEKLIRQGNFGEDEMLSQAWFHALVLENPRRFQFSCVRCQKLCPIERRVFVEFSEKGEQEEEESKE